LAQNAWLKAHGAKGIEQRAGSKERKEFKQEFKIQDPEMRKSTNFQKNLHGAPQVLRYALCALRLPLNTET
jgi:hypothetical protein